MEQKIKNKINELTDELFRSKKILDYIKNNYFQVYEEAEAHYMNFEGE